MNSCKFCQIVSRQIPARIIYENKKVISFFPKKLEIYGHTLIAPKQHYADLYDIPQGILCELIKVLKKITLAYKEKINASGMNLMHASGIDGQQSVFHFHIHLIPRYKDDGFDIWPKSDYKELNLDEIKNKIAKEILK